MKPAVAGIGCGRSIQSARYRPGGSEGMCPWGVCMDGPPSFAER